LPAYSHSRLNTFENCGLHYQYRYVDKIRTGWQSIEAFMGKCVHEVLEELYKDLSAAQSDGPEPLVARFEKLWDEKLTSDVHVVRPDLDAGYYRQAGGRCIRNYWERNYPFVIDPAKIIGLEMRVDLDLDSARKYRMMGFIDRAQHAESGVIEIHDYKSSARLPRDSVLRYDRQLSLYEIGLRQRFPDTEKVRLIWHYVAHGKEFVEERTQKDLDRIKRNCISLINTIEKATVFPAKKGPLCAWCEYQDRCPEWADSKPAASPAFPGGRPRPQAINAARRPSPTAAIERQVPPATSVKKDSPSKTAGENPGKNSPSPVAPASGSPEPEANRPAKKPSQLRLF
jgi:putative RecB family exonuclease